MGPMMFDWSIYKGNMNWLSERTIGLTRAGSRAYGTSLPGSDEDIRGVCVAPRRYQLGFMNVVREVKQDVPDLVVWELREFFRQAAAATVPVLEMLFADPSDRLLWTHTMDMIYVQRRFFMSTKIGHSLRGFAFANLKRMQAHPDEAHGKRAYHVVRLMRMCREVLSTGHLIVRRPDAAELVEIRLGSWSRERVMEFFLEQDKELAELPSVLPESVDYKKLDSWCADLMESWL